MKVMAAYILHYGLEYLEYSIKSLQDSVDDIYIFYSPNPSFGKKTGKACPESEKDLQALAFKFPKVKWKTGWFDNESRHRRAYESLAQVMEYDVVVISDYDEVWDKESLDEAIRYVADSDKQRFRVPMIHLWQDFDVVCKDLAQPERFYKPKGSGLDYVPMKTPVWHFGYAISDDMMRYKWSGIHGHQDEFRENWLEDKWLVRATKDVHPTNHDGFWNAEPYDKNQLPEFMKDHPYWNLKRIDEKAFVSTAKRAKRGQRTKRSRKSVS